MKTRGFSLNDGSSVAEQDGESVAALAADALSAAQQRVAARIELFFAELELAARSGAAILVLTLVVAGLLLTTWLIVMGLIAYFAIRQGVPVGLTGLTLAMLQLGTVVWLWRRMRVLTGYLTLPQSRGVSRQPGEGNAGD